MKKKMDDTTNVRSKQWDRITEPMLMCRDIKVNPVQHLQLPRLLEIQYVLESALNCISMQSWCLTLNTKEGQRERERERWLGRRKNHAGEEEKKKTRRWLIRLVGLPSVPLSLERSHFQPEFNTSTQAFFWFSLCGCSTSLRDQLTLP